MRAIGFGLLGALLLFAPGCGGPVDTGTQGSVETQQTETQQPTQEPCAPAPEEQPSPPTTPRAGPDEACKAHSDCKPELACLEQPANTYCTQDSAACTCQVLLW